MKTNLTTLLSVFALVLVANATPQTQTVTAANGWTSPLGLASNTLNTDTAYNFDSSIYKASFGSRHTGVDFTCPTDTAIYPISDGIIRVIVRSNLAALNESVVVIEHKQPSGRVFWATYGHVKASASWSEGNSITSRQILGYVKPYNQSHIHFGINVSQMSRTGWGRCDLATNPTTLGWRDPMPFLKATLNGNLLNYAVVTTPTFGRNVSYLSLSNTIKYTVRNTGSNTIRKVGLTLGVTGNAVQSYSLSSDIAPGATGTLSIIFKTPTSRGAAWISYYLFYHGVSFDTLSDYYIVQ